MTLLTEVHSAEQNCRLFFSVWGEGKLDFCCFTGPGLRYGRQADAKAPDVFQMCAAETGQVFLDGTRKM